MHCKLNAIDLLFHRSAHTSIRQNSSVIVQYQFCNVQLHAMQIRLSFQILHFHSTHTAPLTYNRMSDTPGNPGNLLELSFPPGNPGNLLEICEVS